VSTLRSASSAFRASTTAHVTDEIAAAAASFDAARAAQHADIQRLETAAAEQAELLAAFRQEQSDTEVRYTAIENRGSCHRQCVFVRVDQRR
jgi:hypothetical protein